ncbi:MAG: S8 family serine peptidase [Actinomycetia bacterium]|nr:S8 family serine peptidase [Actinomycetes bacterium]
MRPTQDVSSDPGSLGRCQLVRRPSSAVPTARYGVDLFKGSGTSQAAATVSGAVAVMLNANRALSNDDLEETLRHSADKLVNESEPTVPAAGSSPPLVPHGQAQLDIVELHNLLVQPL